MKLYNSSSLAEKQRMVEKNEQELMQRQQEAQQQQQQMQQQQLEAQAQEKEAEMQLKDSLNKRDNETKILVATITANSYQQNMEPTEPEFTEGEKAKLQESKRQFDKKLQLEKEKLNLNREKIKTDAELKRKALNKPITTNKK